MPLFWGRGWINNKGTHANNFEAGQDLLQYTLVIETAVGSNIVIEAPNQNDAIGFVISSKGAVMGSRVDVILFEEFHLDEGGSGDGELITDFTFDELTNLLTIQTNVPATWQVDLSSLAGGGGSGDTITDFTLVGSNLEIVTDQATWNVNLATLFDENGIEVKVATTAVLPGSPTYNNGASGVGATLTRVGGTIGLIDGYAPVVGDLILVKNQASQIQNGIYEVTSLTGGYVLTRTTNSDETIELDDQIVLVNSGNTQAGTVWAQQTANPVVGTNNIVYIQSSIGGVKQQASGTQVLFQIPWWVTAPKTLSKGNQDFTFNGTTDREFNVKNQGNRSLLIAPVSGLYMMGDIDQQDLGSYFAIIDSNGQMTAVVGNLDGAGGPGPYPQQFTLDGFTNQSSFGGVDVGFGNNASLFSIDGINQIFSFNSTYGDTQLYLDNAFFAFEDIATVRLFLGTYAASSGSGNNDLIVGIGSGANLTNGGNCIIVGHGSGTSLTSDSATLIFGNQSGTAFTASSANLVFGNSSAQVMTGTGNVFIGNIVNAGTSGSRNHCIAIGTNTTNSADNELVVGGNKSTGNHIIDGYFGSGVTDPGPEDFTLHASGGQDLITPTPNIPGADLIMAAGKSSGNAVPGSFKIVTSTVGASGTTLQTLAERVVVDGSTGGTRVLFDHGTPDTLWGRDSTNGGLVGITLGTNLSFTGSTLNASGGGGGGTPGGADKDIQFNDAGSFGGESDFTWDKTTKVFSIKTGGVAAFEIDAINETITTNPDINFLVDTTPTLFNGGENFAWNATAAGGNNKQQNVVFLGELQAAGGGQSGVFLFGEGSTADNSNIIALGTGQIARGNRSILLGFDAFTGTDDCIAIGTGSTALTVRQITIGNTITTTGSSDSEDAFFTGNNYTIVNDYGDCFVYGSGSVDFVFQGTSANRNLMIGVAPGAIDASSSHTFTMKSGVAPTSNPADSAIYFVKDIVAGNAAPHFRTEAGEVVKLYNVAAVTTAQGIADALTTLGLLASSTIVGGGGYTDEQAQDAVGAMIDGTLNYVDGTPLLQRAALTGDVTALAGSNSTTIANDAVTFAKFQNINTGKLLGRNSPGSGDVEEITLGTGLSFSGTTLNATAAPVVFADNVFRIQDNGDATKQLAWEVSGISTATTRTITALNISGTDVLSNGALTATRIPFWSASGLVDDADLTFVTDTLTCTIFAVGSRIEPVTNDGAPLGSITKQFSDLFLAEGGVINWDNGDATLTQVGDVVTLAGADLKISSPGNAATSVLTTNGTQTVTEKRMTKRTGTTASSATPTINTDNVDFYSITALAANITSFTTNLSGTPTEAQTLWIAITDNGTARTITWGASFESSSVTLPSTTVISQRLDVGLIWNTVTSKWRCVAVA